MQIFELLCLTTALTISNFAFAALGTESQDAHTYADSIATLLFKAPFQKSSKFFLAHHFSHTKQDFLDTCRNYGIITGEASLAKEGQKSDVEVACEYLNKDQEKDSEIQKLIVAEHMSHAYPEIFLS